VTIGGGLSLDAAPMKDSQAVQQTEALVNYYVVPSCEQHPTCIKREGRETIVKGRERGIMRKASKFERGKCF